MGWAVRRSRAPLGRPARGERPHPRPGPARGARSGRERVLERRRGRPMPGLLRGIARTAVISGTATAVSNRVSRRQAERWQEQGSEVQPMQRVVAAEPAQPAPQESTIDQLKELGELKAQGVLTEEEF